MKLEDLNFASKTLEKVKSPINGELVVIKDLFFGTYIKGGGLPQSGGLAEKIWKVSLKKVKKDGLKPSSVLILGLGGGGIAKIVRRQWPKARIVGVDIDPIMIELGKKYLGLEEQDVEIHVGDAYESVEKLGEQGRRFDLICSDMYVEDEIPEKFETDEYIDLVGIILSRSGVAVFNRLFFREKRKKAVKFGEKLEKHFDKVDTIYPEANVMYVCRKHVALNICKH